MDLKKLPEQKVSLKEQIQELERELALLHSGGRDQPSEGALSGEEV